MNVEDVELVTTLAKRFKKRHDTLWHILSNKSQALVNDAYGRSYSTAKACHESLGG